MSDAAPTLDTDAAFARYEAVRFRLPQAAFPTSHEAAPSLAALADRYDGFLLDAFGVLNVGDTPIPGAVERLRDFRAEGKGLCVLTNAASYTRAQALAKYRRLGFDFAEHEVVSSRDVAAAHLVRHARPGALWAAIAAPGDGFEDIQAEVADLLDRDLWERADAFLFLSSLRWTRPHQERLAAALAARPRPLVVANPDLVAPREDGLSVEPGFWAHEIADRTGLAPHFYGKPYADAFAAAAARLGPGRLAMVGDTLHTDILGGRAAGLGTILVADHGLFAGRPITPYIDRSGIRPDAVVATT